jgi:hypothetical protein
MSVFGGGRFDMLRGQVADNARRLDVIDQAGTRGVGALSVQVAEVIKDVSDMRRELDEHGKQHQAEAAARQSGRRWLVGSAIALVAAVEGPLLFLVTHVH